MPSKNAVSKKSKKKTKSLLDTVQPTKIRNKCFRSYFHIIEKGLHLKYPQANLNIEYLLRTSVKPVSKVYDDFSDSGIEKCVLDMLVSLKKCTKSHDGTVYIVDGTGLEMRKIILTSQGITHGLKVPITSQTNIAAYVAENGSYICLNKIKNLHADPRFPYGSSFYRSIPKGVLCLAAKTEDGKVFAVFELVRFKSDDYTKIEILFARTQLSWFLKALLTKYRRQIYKVDEVLMKFHEILLKIFYRFSTEDMDCENLISEIMIKTRDYIRAEEIKYYVTLNRESRKVYLFEEGFIDKQRLYRKKLPFQLENDEILKYVWDNNQFLNVSGEKLKFFDVDESNVFSILCVPIGSNDKILGVVKVINKLTGVFTVKDAALVRHSGIYCALGYRHHWAKQESSLSSEIVKDQEKAVLYYSSSCDHDTNTFVSALPEIILPENINSFLWYPNKEEREYLAEITWWMFRHLFKEEAFFHHFAQFLNAVRHGYRCVPYHNFEHAFNFTHTIFVILNLHHDYFSMFEKICFMLAALCHDIDHPAFSNKFLKQFNYPLAQLYSSSYLENYHSHIARLLINHFQLFFYLPPEEKLLYDKEIHTLIIDTDLQVSLRKVGQLENLVQNNEFDDTLHRHLLKSVIMTTADLSVQAKPLLISQKLTSRWFQEGFAEGDAFRSRGVTPHPDKDRLNLPTIAEKQVNFISNVCERFACMLTKFLPKTVKLYDQFKKIRNSWKDALPFSDILIDQLKEDPDYKDKFQD